MRYSVDESGSKTITRPYGRVEGSNPSPSADTAAGCRALFAHEGVPPDRGKRPADVPLIQLVLPGQKAVTWPPGIRRTGRRVTNFSVRKPAFESRWRCLNESPASAGLLVDLSEIQTSEIGPGSTPGSTRHRPCASTGRLRAVFRLPTPSHVDDPPAPKTAETRSGDAAAGHPPASYFRVWMWAP